MLIALVLLLAAGAMGVFIWHYRRKAAEREAASAERMKAFLDQARASAGRAAEAPSATPATTPAASLSPVPASAASAAARPLPEVSGISARAPLLTAEQRTLYLLLKMGLPEHEVFACVSLAAFVRPADNVSGFAREAQERRLAEAMVDFLVCDKAMKPVAAVLCGARSGKAAEAAAFAAACAAATGIRWVDVSPQALPRRDAIKPVVLGTA